MKKAHIVITLLVALGLINGCSSSKEFDRVQKTVSSLSDTNHFVEIKENRFGISTGKLRLPSARLEKLKKVLVGLRETKKPLEKTKRITKFNLIIHAPEVVLDSWIPVNNHWFYITLDRDSKNESRVTVRQRSNELHMVLKGLFKDYVMQPVFLVDGKDVAGSVDQIIQRNMGYDLLQDEAKRVLEVSSDRRDGISYTYFFYSSGRLSGVKRYLNGTLHGIRLKFFENGNIQAVMPYENGQLNGVRYFLDQDGNIISKVEFKNGK